MIVMGNAIPGLCACGVRVLRATDDEGVAHTIDAAFTNAPAELRAWAEGRPSYVLKAVDTRRKVFSLIPRTDADIAQKPAGFTNERIHLHHRCKITDSEVV